ncbi:MAG: SCP2 sterol-binding domain-containing protein [Gammaproteobacteria bacterium]|nr:SCP2 sterol-binding domain-containing protein [Gammaproteobacteria bacterium]
MILPDPLIDLIETAFNALLELDEGVAPRLRAMQGKVITVQIDGFDLLLHFAPQASGMQLLKSFQGSSDTLISGTPFSLLSLKSQPGRALFRGEVSMQGDVVLGKKFNRLFQQLDIDWPEHVSFLFGDFFTYQLERGVKQLKNWGVRSGRSVQQDISDYLQEEAEALPTSYCVEDFLAHIEALRSDTDRLQARVERLLSLSVKESVE